MIVKTITLHKFRNYDDLTLEFPSGLNIIVGPNGAGKTNIVEAIQYLSLARSFRTSNDQELIKEGEDGAIIKAILSDDGPFKKTLQIDFVTSGKKISLNGTPLKKISELKDVVNVLVFEPKDVLFFNDSPRIRRRYLDTSLSKLTSNYLDYFSRYEKLLDERNRLLKFTHPDLLAIEVITKQMVTFAKQISLYRKNFIDSLNETLPSLMANLEVKAKGELKIEYLPFVEVNEEYEQKAIEAYKKSLDNDLRYRTTGVGIQREDIVTYFRGKPIDRFGSQGQKRLVALALKLAPYYLTENKEKRPIVVLDDVLSELDGDHQQRLITLLKNWTQVFITATTFNGRDANVYEVTPTQKIVRRNFL